MATNLTVCSVDEELESQLKSFRKRREIGCSAIVMKVQKDSQTIVCDEVLEDTNTEEVRDSLPDHQPRFVLLSYPLTHTDGRLSFPLIFIFSTPRDCMPTLQMMYAGSKLSLVDKIRPQKIFEIRELEDLTEEFIQEKLLFSG